MNDDDLALPRVTDPEPGDDVAVFERLHEELRQVMLEERRRAERAEAARDEAHELAAKASKRACMLDEENGHLAAKLDAEVWERRKAEAELERMRPVVKAAETARNYRDEVLSNYTPANPAKVCHLGLGSYVSQRDLALWHAVDEYMHEVRRMARAALEPEPDGE